MKTEITIKELLESYDWEEVFGEGSGGNCDRQTEAARPGSTISTDPPSRTDVVAIIAAVNGENDESDWVGVFTLRDGRTLVASGGCDYTGWDCQASNSLVVAESLEEAMQYAIDAAQAERLGMVEEWTNARAKMNT